MCGRRERTMDEGEAGRERSARVKHRLSGVYGMLQCPSAFRFASFLVSRRRCGEESRPPWGLKLYIYMKATSQQQQPQHIASRAGEDRADTPTPRSSPDLARRKQKQTLAGRVFHFILIGGPALVGGDDPITIFRV